MLRGGPVRCVPVPIYFLCRLLSFAVLLLNRVVGGEFIFFSRMVVANDRLPYQISVYSYTHIRPLLLNQRSMKVDFAVPSNHTSLCTGNASTPPSLPPPASLRCGSQEVFTLPAFLPTDVDRWEGHSDLTDARLHFDIWSLGGDQRW